MFSGLFFSDINAKPSANRNDLVGRVDVGETLGVHVTDSSSISRELSSSSLPGAFCQKPKGDPELLEPVDVSDSMEMDRCFFCISRLLFSMLTSAMRAAAHSPHPAWYSPWLQHAGAVSFSEMVTTASESVSTPMLCASRSTSSSSAVSELESDADDLIISGISFCGTPSISLDWKLDMCSDDLLLRIEEAAAVPVPTSKLPPIGDSWSVRALEAVSWFQRPFLTADEANSEAMENRTSSFDGISPMLSLRQHMMAMSYKVRPALTPAWRMLVEARKMSKASWQRLRRSFNMRMSASTSKLMTYSRLLSLSGSFN
mmetsp:Transcript_27946/g.78315  ORF Transcript_27946/g.78315 Transcript_27946/m.78315 type:complete len:315 (-) Transcript_27946:87-1031(-)